MNGDLSRSDRTPSVTRVYRKQADGPGSRQPVTFVCDLDQSYFLSGCLFS